MKFPISVPNKNPIFHLNDSQLVPNILIET
jgi:hypothetical protein